MLRLTIYILNIFESFLIVFNFAIRSTPLVLLSVREVKGGFWKSEVWLAGGWRNYILMFTVLTAEAETEPDYYISFLVQE